MSRRGQAALEFLSTYGFAFLIILVMIGALSYFGVLSPNKLIPNRCTMPAEFQCFEFRITRATAPANYAVLDVVVLNQLGNSLDFNTAASTYSAASQFGFADGTVGAPTPNTCTFTPPTGIVGGARATITCTMSSAGANFPASGEKVKVAVDFQYRELGRTYWVPIRGEILGTLI